MAASESAGGRDSAPENNGSGLQVLPDFCSGETVLRVFVLVMVLALMALLLRGGGEEPLVALFPVALFIAWVGFSSVLMLCLLQRWTQRRSLSWQVVITTLIPVLNTTLVHLGAEYFSLAGSETRLSLILVAALLSVIAMRYFYIVAAWQRETHAVAQAREQAMRARVRPHFIFNSMNTIAGLCRTDPARAEQVTLDLADLFRATFATSPSHSLAEELALVRTYLAIEKTRFGERLQLDWDVSDAEDLKALQVPALILQPMVENTIQHGLAPTAEGGRIWLRVRREGNQLIILIGNSTGIKTGRGTGTAGEDVRARLRQAFGGRANFAVRHDGGSYEVRIALPTANPGG